MTGKDIGVMYEMDKKLYLIKEDLQSCFTRETTFVTSCLLSCTSSFPKVANSIFSEDLFSEGTQIQIDSP